MVPKKSRLPREGFRARGYEVVKTPFFSLKFKDNTSGVQRIGVVVGKSVDKRAVRRNFWERQAKAELLGVKNLNKDLIITIFPAIGTLKKADFKKEIKKILHDLSLRRHL